MTTPQPTEPSFRPKRHRLRTTIIILVVVFIVLPVLALGWTGIYHIPVVSSLFGTGKPIDLGIHPTAADLASAEADNPTTVDVTPGEFRWTANKSFSGLVPIDDVHTSAELTAFIEKYHGDSGYIRDIQVKVRNGGLIISAFVVPAIKAPVYVDVDVAMAGPQSVTLNLKKAKIGRLTVPEKYYAEITKTAQRIVNREIALVQGFSISSLTYSEGTAHFTGTMPASVSLLPGSQTVKSFLE